MANSENKEEVMQDEPKKTVKADKAPKKKSRFQNLKAEFHRIIWPDKETITKETTAVVIVTVVLGVIIALLDFIIKAGLDKIIQLG